MAVPARDPNDPHVAPADPRAGDPRGGRHAAANRQSSRGWHAFREFVLIIVIALGLSAVVRAFVVQAFYVPSASMEQTLLINDRIIASRITTKVSGVARGEIVVFKDPSTWLPEPPPPPGGPLGWLQQALTFVGVLPSDSGKDLVKRAIGIGGDRVACCDAEGRIVVNGVPLDEQYIVGPTDQVLFDVEVPQGSVFVMGDNRGDSRDSRFHLDQDNGSVPVDAVVGRVVVVMWPFDRLGIERIPEIFGNPALDMR
ncbi:MAG: signal peptidase I [Actinobacteria bacterium]|nr:signal peptidase I [Actinomycetota bacterium]